MALLQFIITRRTGEIVLTDAVRPAARACAETVGGRGSEEEDEEEEEEEGKRGGGEEGKRGNKKKLIRIGFRVR